MNILITGVAGFIGSNLCDYILQNTNEKDLILGLDDYSTGREEFLSEAAKDRRFQFQEVDLLDFALVRTAICAFKPEIVIHLAANADVRFGLDHTRKDLEQGTLVAYNVLESSRLAGAKKFAFSSTGSVYGEPKVFPTPEDCPFPVQTSLYAASKLAAEGLIQAYAEGFGMQAYIFRFVSILGERYSHGHVFDFVKKLLKNPGQLQVLGDGKQSKAYLYVGDCVKAIWHLLRVATEKVNVFNLGPDEHITVSESLDVICKTMSVQPERLYTGGTRGWVGDSPFIFLDCSKLKKTGWAATLSIRESVEKTARYLLANRWLLEERQGGK